MLLLVLLTIVFFSLRVQMLEEQVRDFPEQLRRERSAASAQVEALHSRAVSAFADRSVDLDKRVQQEARRADVAESELKAARDRCSSLETQLKGVSNSALTLQVQLSKTDSDWRRELDAMQQRLRLFSSQVDSMSKELQTQTARADKAIAKLREAEDELQHCRSAIHQMSRDRDACCCDEMQEKIRCLVAENEARLQEMSDQVDFQMNVQDGFLSYIQALSSSPGSDVSYLGSSVVPCADRDLADMDEALSRILKTETQPQPLSATARMIWLRLCSDSPSPDEAPLRVCIDWLIHHDAAGSFGLPAFQRPMVDLALASLNVRLNFKEFLDLLVSCVTASHSLSKFLMVSGPSLIISRAQFKQSCHLFGLKRLSSDGLCDEAFDEMDTHGNGMVSFHMFHEWFQHEQSSDTSQQRLLTQLQQSSNGK
jgi:hypothetical protein